MSVVSNYDYQFVSLFADARSGHITLQSILQHTRARLYKNEV